MDLTKLKEEDIKLDDAYLLGLVHKDIVKGLHYYYSKIDKKWLDCPSFKDKDGNLDDKSLKEFLLNGSKLLISRYAKMTFSEEDFNKIQIGGLSMCPITERTDEEGTWIVCQISWMYFTEDENGNKSVMQNLSGLKYVKTDYIPPLEDYSSILEKHPELSSGNFTSISAKEALDYLKENLKK